MLEEEENGVSFAYFGWEMSEIELEGDELHEQRRGRIFWNFILFDLLIRKAIFECCFPREESQSYTASALSCAVRFGLGFGYLPQMPLNPF